MYKAQKSLVCIKHIKNSVYNQRLNTGPWWCQVVTFLSYLWLSITKQTWDDMIKKNYKPLAFALEIIDFFYLDTFDTYKTQETYFFFLFITLRTTNWTFIHTTGLWKVTAFELLTKIFHEQREQSWNTTENKLTNK